jgi:hypothetical protein
MSRLYQSARDHLLTIRGRGRNRKSGVAMTAVVLPFPRRAPWKSELLREGDAWLVRARDHAWLHGSLADALADAKWLAANHRVAIAILTDLQPEEIQNVV